MRGSLASRAASQDVPARAIDGPFLQHALRQTSVVICALNEAANLPYVLPRIPASVKEVVLVDGRSTDDTVEEARRLWPGIRVVTQPGKGKGDAVRHGLQQVTGEFVVLLDADGSMAPEELHLFLSPLVNGFDYAKGSRFLGRGGTTDMTLPRRAGNWLLMSLVNVLYGTRYTDMAYGYNAARREALQQIALVSKGFEIEVEMNIAFARAGFRVAEVPSFERRRVHGDSKLHSLPDGARIFRTVVRNLRRKS
jgi:glycosyltransferase involved in cell wall biosynthesis